MGSNNPSNPLNPNVSARQFTMRLRYGTTDAEDQIVANLKNRARLGEKIRGEVNANKVRAGEDTVKRLAASRKAGRTQWAPENEPLRRNAAAIEKAAASKQENQEFIAIQQDPYIPQGKRSRR